MKNISYSAAASQASSVSGTTTSPSPNPTGSATLPSIDFDDYPQGLLVKVILYHPSLFKIEQDFPNVIYIQDIPLNHFLRAKFHLLILVQLCHRHQTSSRTGEN